jgi:hypothetical protein
VLPASRLADEGFTAAFLPGRFVGRLAQHIARLQQVEARKSFSEAQKDRGLPPEKWSSLK